MRSTRLLQMLILSLIVVGIGCSHNGTSPESTSSNLNLTDEFGGYSATAEKPGFDDPDLLAEANSDQEYDDYVLTFSSVDSLISDPESGYYHLRIVWGRLRYDSTVDVATDWSGSVSVNRGAEIVRRVIRFEPDQDYILPRSDRKLIEWVSKTTVHNDGIAIDIVVPRPAPVFDTTITVDTTFSGDTIRTIVVDTSYAPTEPVSVAFNTDPHSRIFTLAEISTLDTIIYLEDSNAVVFHGMKLNNIPCPRGFLAGHWGFDDDGLGIFKGFWLSPRGTVTGYLNGHYGVNDVGERVFFGKWISRSGEFEGYLKGSYGQHPDEHANVNAWQHAGGWFQGDIYSSEREKIGVLKGKFHSSPRLEGGFFQGRWAIRCLDVDNGDVLVGDVFREGI